MPEFSIVTRKKKSAPTQEVTQEDQSSLLSKAGAGALSGLHTLGSMLSWPSRLLHGGINAAVGGKEGFGENYLNPFDSRGSVEGSRHLINAGILNENDPNKWEWGDLGRGLADIALDPTTYAGPGLTKLGLQAGKKGTLAGGRVAQHAAGQRALLNIGLPFAAPAVSIGTGPATAKALEAAGKYSGLTRASKAASTSFPARAAKAMFYAPAQGTTHTTLQPEVIKQTHELRAADKATKADIIRAARNQELKAVDPKNLVRTLENTPESALKAGYQPHPATVNDPLASHVMVRINPQGKILEHFPGLKDSGHLDELLTSGAPVNAPLMHIGPNGEVVFGKGMVHPTHVKQAAKAAHEADLAAIAERAKAAPDWNDEFSAVKAAHENFPGFLNTELIPFRDIAKATGKTPAEIVEALNKEIPGGYSLHRHDFPDQIVNDGKQGEFFWSPKDVGDIGSHDKPFIGFSLRPEVGSEFTSKGLPTPKQILNPEKKTLLEEYAALERKGSKANRAKHAARIIEEIQAGHGSEEALSALAKMRDLKEAGMSVMVPRSQEKQVRRMFGGGPVERSVPEYAKAIRKLPEYKNLKGMAAKNLAKQRERGVGFQEGLMDPTSEFWPRRQTITPEKQAKGLSRGSSVMPAKTAEDTQRKWFLKGHYGGREGMNALVGSPAAHEAIAEAGGDWRAAIPVIEREHLHMLERFHQTGQHRAAVRKSAKTLSSLDEKLAKKTEALAGSKTIADQLKNTDLTVPDNKRVLTTHLSKQKTIERQIKKLEEKRAVANAAHEQALTLGNDRVKAIAKYMAANPQLKGADLFGNHPIADMATSALGTNKKYAMAPAVFNTLQKELNKGDQAMTLEKFLKERGYAMRTAAEHIAGHPLDEPGALKAFLRNNTVDSKLAEQLKALTPSFQKPAAVNEVADKIKSGMAWWKGLTLAFPASRVRDAVGGVVQNVLHGWADPKFLAHDVRQLLTGKIVTRDYSHVPEIQDWLAKAGKEWSPENQTEALRQMVAVHLPSEHGMLGDVPVGQAGAGLEQLTHNVPGQQQTTFTRQFLTDPLQALAGRDPGGATWFGKAEPGESALGRLWRAAKQPFTGIRGVGDQAETMFAPVKASEIVSANSDAYNRVGPFMQQIHGGTKADVAAQNVNRAQIDYNPDTFTAVERGIKNHLLPFYSFNSRIIPETVRQLSDLRSPTSQLVKNLDRAHGGGDASVPDYVMSGTGIPLGLRDDGSKSYLTGLGQMYEPAVSQLGLLAGAATDPRSLQAAGYDTLAQLNPMIGTPLQRITGQSFFQRGEPISNMDPIAGRLMSNVGESMGLRSPDSGPVKFPGSSFVDMALGATPFGRLAAQVRTLADPRKDIASKLVDTLSGARVTDISPQKQMATLQKRAEDLARSQGAWEQRTVGFPKEQLAKLAETNPELAAKQQYLQNMITGIKRKRAAKRKEDKAKKKD